MKKFDRPLLGAVYLIEQECPPEQQLRDLENIAGTGLGLVVLWPPVSRWDAPDGVSIAFDSVDRVMDICSKLGLKAILELEGQNPAFQFMPDYLFKTEYLSENDTGKHWVNYLHPEVDKIISDYVRAVAGHFKDHPALFGYDLFNEVNFRSTDKYTLEAFQGWLKAKYQNIRELNRVWGRFFTGFSQVRLDNLDYAYSRWSSLRPQLDFHDFRADTIQRLVRQWGDTVRSVDPDHPVIADSSWSMTYFDNMLLANDDWKVSSVVDIFGLSVYPQSWDIHIASDPCPISQIYNGGVCACPEKPVVVSELQTHNQTVLARDSSVFDELKLWTWQAFMHGIEALIYWKWKPFTRGFQVTGRGMTLQDGTPNQRSAQAAEVARVINANPRLFLGRKMYDSGVAMLYSPECDHFTDLTLPDEKSGFYRDSFAGWYRCLFNRGITPSIIRAADLDQEHTGHLRIMIIPALAMLSREDAARILAFAARGGKLLADGRFAVVDENGFAYSQAPGGGLHELFGYREIDFLSPYADKGACPADRFSVIKLISAYAKSTTSPGHPLCALTEATLYLPVFFGHEISNIRLREIVDPFLSRSIDQACQVLETSPEVDVTVSHGNGVLVGTCNYAHTERRIRVRVDTGKPCRPLWEGVKFNCETGEGSSVLEAVIPAREIAGFHFI
ncbi:MAG TPA: beta-galactosidase [archaeon]|nr:beta-galactosidase [archaeon]